MTYKICCIGAGYVGTPTMAIICKFVPDSLVYVADLDERKINAWMSSELPLYEPGLQPLVEEFRGKKLIFTTDVKKAVQESDIIFVAVNTPTKIVGEGCGVAADLKYIESAARSIALYANSNKIIVEKSTVPVKTASSLEVILKANSKYQFSVLSSPEFLAEGSAIEDLIHPHRVLIGGRLNDPECDKAVDVLVSIYKHWIAPEKIIKMTIWSSELSKLVSNAFLAQRISSINSISALCEEVNGNILEISRAVGMDARIGNKFLNASIGFGGSCFAKDIRNLVYICRLHGLYEVADYWDSVIKMNEYQTKRFSKRVLDSMFSNVSGKIITLFGYAFKANTGDCRETPAAYLTKYLIDEGAILHIYDPAAKTDDMLYEVNRLFGDLPGIKDRFKTFKNEHEAVINSHCICILTEWDIFKSYDYSKFYNVMNKPAFIFDGRNILDLYKLKEIGFDVYGIGLNINGDNQITH